MRISALALATAFGVLPLAAPAQVSVNINVPGIVAVAPPAPRVEYIPTPRPGQVWVQGHWYWNQRDYAWRPGYWQPARANYAYAPGRWVPVSGGYRWIEGDWKRHGKKHDHHHDHYDHYDDHGPGPGHCPPGQAKKGRC
jgi:hypothetical protein